VSDEVRKWRERGGRREEDESRWWVMGSVGWREGKKSRVRRKKAERRVKRRKGRYRGEKRREEGEEEDVL
jgi:hypothetical protein